MTKASELHRLEQMYRNSQDEVRRLKREMRDLKQSDAGTIQDECEDWRYCKVMECIRRQTMVPGYCMKKDKG